LQEAFWVKPHLGQRWVDGAFELNLLCLEQWGDFGDGALDQRINAGDFPIIGHHTRFKLREIEQRIDDGDQAIAFLCQDAEQLALFFRSVAADTVE